MGAIRIRYSIFFFSFSFLVGCTITSQPDIHWAKLQIGKKEECARIESKIFFNADGDLEIRKYLIESEKSKLKKIISEYNSRCTLPIRMLALKFTIRANSEYTDGSLLFDGILNRLSIGTIPLTMEETVRVDYATDLQSGYKEYNFFEITGSMPFFLPHRWKMKTDYSQIFEYLLYQVIYDLEWHNYQNRRISYTKEYSDIELIDLCIRNSFDCKNDLFLKTKLHLRADEYKPFRNMLLAKVNSAVNGYKEVCQCVQSNTKLCSESREFKVYIACKEYDKCNQHLPDERSICERDLNKYFSDSITRLKMNPPSKGYLASQLIHYNSLYEIAKEFDLAKSPE